MVAVPTVAVYFVNRLFVHGVLFNSANCIAAVFILLFVGGIRLVWRMFLDHPLGGGPARCDQQRPQPPHADRGRGGGRRLGHQRLQVQQDLRPPGGGGGRRP